MSGIMMQLLGTAGGLSAGANFVLSKPSNNTGWSDMQTTNAIKTDSQNNVYWLMGGQDGGLVKVDLDGTAVFDTRLEVYGSSPYNIQGLAIDSQDRAHIRGVYPPNNEDNVFLECINGSTGAADYRMTFTDKEYSNGSGARKYDIAGSDQLAIDANDKLYFASGENSGSSSKRVISWQATAGSSSYTFNKSSSISGSNVSNDPYVIGVGIVASTGHQIAHYGNGRNEFVLLRQNLSDSEASSEKSAYQVSSGVTNTMYVTHIDSSGNFYGLKQQSSDTDATVVKWNISGTKQWETKLTKNTSYISRVIIYPGAITTDDDGNVYCNITVEKNNRWRPMAVKLNSSGTLQWINGVEYSQTTDMRANAIHVDKTGNYYLGTGQNPVTCSKLPVAGNLTGTFSLWQYNITYSTDAWVTASSTSAYSNLGNATDGMGEYFTYRGSGGGADRLSFDPPRKDTLT